MNPEPKKVTIYLLVNANGNYIAGEDEELAFEQFHDEGYSGSPWLLNTVEVEVPLPPKRCLVYGEVK